MGRHPSLRGTAPGCNDDSTQGPRVGAGTTAYCQNPGTGDGGNINIGCAWILELTGCADG